MPIEIRELVVKAVVDPKKGGEAAPAAEKEKPKGGDREKVVAQAADQVLEMLRRQRER